MENDFGASVRPSFEDVQRRFEQWRGQRKRGEPIPDDLWEGAVSLCAEHGPSKVSGVLHLDYKALKKRFHAICPDRYPGVAPSDFITLDLQTSLPEIVVEMERNGGRMRIHVKGLPGFHPMELMDGFWGCR